MDTAKKIFWYFLVAALALSFGPQLIAASADFVSATLASTLHSIFFQ